MAKGFYVEVVENFETVFRATGASLSVLEAVAKAVAAEYPGTPVEVRRTGGTRLPPVATARKAVVAAVLTVRECLRAYGKRETARKDWRSIARAKSAELRSVPELPRLSDFYDRGERGWFYDPPKAWPYH